MTPIQKGQWLVKEIGGISLPVLGQGTIDFTATIDGKQFPGEFKNVLFVPSLNANLISVGTASNAGVEIIFTGNTVLFKHEGTVIMTGQRSGKELYHHYCERSNYSCCSKTEDPFLHRTPKICPSKLPCHTKNGQEKRRRRIGPARLEDTI
jgi:hypothetical protein